MLAYFVEKLRSIRDGDGTLLDHSLVLYGSNMGNSNQHLHYDVPHVLIGGASGKLKGDRHLAFPSRTVPTGNLLLSIADIYGLHLIRSATARAGSSTFSSARRGRFRAVRPSSLQPLSTGRPESPELRSCPSCSGCRSAFDPAVR